MEQREKVREQKKSGERKKGKESAIAGEMAMEKEESKRQSLDS